jgi:signal transduction histidine kinase/ActR/RegA family two-component response regulator
VLNHPNQKGFLRAWKAVGARSEVTGLLVIVVRPQLAGLAQRADVYVLLMVIVAVVFVTALMVARAAGKRLSAPLEHFAMSTEVQAATGHVDAITPPPGATPPQEIELVYTAFNYLVLSLRESYDELRRTNAVLDQRVADRTAELKTANDSKSAFLAMTSHEIRTPLNAILGLTDALLAQPLPSAATERLQTIRSSGVLLMEVVNDLLDLSQAEAGRLVLRPSHVEIHELCRDICRLFGARAERQGISLYLEFGADGPVWVETDGSRLRQVLLNLVGNGLKFTRKGSVVLRCEVTEQNGRSRLLFTVADTGPGIPADKQARLFEPYFRGEDPGVQNVVGTGLGLPISQSLVALLGGNLEVDSVLGRGTRFFFNLDLPALAAPQVPTPVADAEGSAPSILQLRILAVDDNIANQEVIRALLEHGCARLEVVGTGREAIALLKSETFDVALVDLEMPGVDGIEVVRQVKAAGAAAASAQCRMFAVSAHPIAQLRERCRGHGFDGYVEKPLNRKELMDAIASAC